MRADPAWDRHRFPSPRGRGGEDLPLRRLRHHPQDGRLRPRDRPDRCLGDRPGLGDGHRPVRGGGARASDFLGERRQRRYGGHSVGRGGAREPHDFHRGQLRPAGGEKGAREDPPGGGGESRRSRGRARSASRAHRPRRERREPRRASPTPPLAPLRREERPRDDDRVLRAAERRSGPRVQRRCFGELRLRSPGGGARSGHRDRPHPHPPGHGGPRRGTGDQCPRHRGSGRGRGRHGNGLHPLRAPPRRAWRGTESLVSGLQDCDRTRDARDKDALHREPRSGGPVGSERGRRGARHLHSRRHRQRPRERDGKTLLRAPPDAGESASPIERPPPAPMKRRTVVSMEQALSLSYATLRFVQLGWRVIRLEATPSGSELPGDPNRYIGEVVAGEDRRSYFIAPNVGKEAIALNLKEERGREVLKEILSELDVEIFCCNTLPSRYRSLGIDYRTLRAVRSDLIWAGISAMGPEYPKTPGYDPALQAIAGYMELTGEREGPPMLSGVPLIDLKRGVRVSRNVFPPLVEKRERGKGRKSTSR